MRGQLIITKSSHCSEDQLSIVSIGMQTLVIECAYSTVCSDGLKERQLLQ